MKTLLRYFLKLLVFLIIVPAFACMFFCGVLIFLGSWVWHAANLLERDVNPLRSLHL